MSPTGIDVRVVYLQNVSHSLMRLQRKRNYNTHKSCRSDTSWLPLLWECFAFKQTGSCRRWRRVCRGVKETALLNETVEAGEFVWYCFVIWRNSSFEVTLLCVWKRKFVTEAVGVAPLPNRLWFLSYRDTMNHRSAAYLLWNDCCDIIGIGTTNRMIIIDKRGLIVMPSYRSRLLLVFPLFAGYKVYEIEAFWFAAVQ